MRTASSQALTEFAHPTGGVLVYPGISLITLAVVLGVWLLVFGVMEIVLAFRLRSVGQAATGVAPAI